MVYIRTDWWRRIPPHRPEGFKTFSPEELLYGTKTGKTLTITVLKDFLIPWLPVESICKNKRTKLQNQMPHDGPKIVMWLHLKPCMNLLLLCIILDLSSVKKIILFPASKCHLAPALTCVMWTDLSSECLGKGAVQ